MSRSDEFIRLYNIVDEHLRRITGLERERSFAHVVKTAARRDKAVRAHQDLLIGFGELRNAIVHDRHYPHKVIAEPHPDVVEEFARIVRVVTSPPKLVPKFQRPIRCFRPAEPLIEALAYMRDNDYSQIVVEGDQGLNLLTTEAVARWFERKADDDLVSVRETTVGDALQHQPPGSFAIMSRDQTTFDALDLFSQLPAAGRSRLFAIIITHSGKPTETPLGIVTPWDLVGDDSREHW